MFLRIPWNESEARISHQTPIVGILRAIAFCHELSSQTGAAQVARIPNVDKAPLWRPRMSHSCRVWFRQRLRLCSWKRSKEFRTEFLQTFWFAWFWILKWNLKWKSTSRHPHNESLFIYPTLRRFLLEIERKKCLISTTNLICHARYHLDEKNFFVLVKHNLRWKRMHIFFSISSLDRQTRCAINCDHFDVSFRDYDRIFFNSSETVA